MLIRNSRVIKTAFCLLWNIFMFVCVIKIYSRHYFKHSLVCYPFELNAHKFSSIVTHKNGLTSLSVKVATNVI